MNKKLFHTYTHILQKCYFPHIVPIFMLLSSEYSPFIAPADGVCAPELKVCNEDYIFYTDDGSRNNLNYSNFGQAGYPFERILPASFADGYDQPRVSVNGSPLPNTRKIRTTLLPNQEYADKKLNAIFYAFGQYSSHHASEHRPIKTEGDDRINQNPKIFSTNTILFRFHNFMAKELRKLIGLTNSCTYMPEELVSPCIRMYFFAEFVPALIGQDAVEIYNLCPLPSGYSDSYNPNISPHTFHEYTLIVGRLGHSTVRGSFQYAGVPHWPMFYRLREKYFHMDFFLKKDVFFNIIEIYAFSQCNEQDKYITEEDVEKFKSLFSDVEDIDLYVAGLLEKPYKDSTVGATFTCLLGAQATVEICR